MKAFGRILIALLVLCLLILLGYIAWVYILPKWRALLFYGYFALGLLIWAIGTIRNIMINRNSNWAALLLKNIVVIGQATDMKSRLNRFRDVMAAVALLLSALIVWPVDAAYGLLLGRRYPERNLSAEELSVLQAVGQPDTYKSLYALLVVLVLLGLAFLGVDLKIYGILMLGLMVASASFRHVSYIIGTVSLPARLRRAATSPYVLFLVVAGGDFATLILGLTAIELHARSTSITLAALVETGRELWQGESALRDILKGTRPTEQQLIVSIVGLLLSLAVLKVLTQFGEFRRTDEDWVWLAGAENLLGNFAVALRYLRNVKSWDKDSLSAEIVALLGVNQIEDAAAKVKSLLEQQREAISEGEIFRNLFQACLLPRMPQSVFPSVLKRSIDSKVPDALMQDALGLVVQNHLQQQSLELFNEDASSFPLSIARIHLLSKEREQCLAVLNAHLPAADLDKLIAQTMVFTARVIDPATTADQDAKTFSAFIEEAIPLMQKLIHAPMELWQNLLLYTEIERSLKFARALGEDKVQQLSYLADSLAEQQKDERFKRAVPVIQAQFA